MAGRHNISLPAAPSLSIVSQFIVIKINNMFVKSLIESKKKCSLLKSAQKIDKLTFQEEEARLAVFLM